MLELYKRFYKEEISYEEWLSIRNELYAEVDKYSAELNSFPKESNGGVSDEIRNSSKFKKIKNLYNMSFKKLQDFNKNKQYKNFRYRYTKERRKNRYK